MAAAATTEVTEYSSRPPDRTKYSRLFHYPTAITDPVEKWLLDKGLVEYFDRIYPLLIKFFTLLTHRLEESGTRPLRIIAVGSFAKHFYNTTLHFADFDFQVYEKDPIGDYLSDSYKRYVSEVITPEWETDIKEYLATLIMRFISHVNSLYPDSPFTLITNDIDTGTPPGPLKISIQYKGGYESGPIKIVDINYSKQNVFAYNKVGLELMDKFEGNIPVKEMTFRDYDGFIKTLQPCVFYEEKRILSGMGDTGIPKHKLKEDLKFWKYHCKRFIDDYGVTFVPMRSRKTRKSKTSLKKRIQKNRKSRK